MALPKEQIDSIISQLHKFGEDGIAFDDWMTAVTSLVRAHGDVGAFRTTARSLWLAHNKKGVEQLVLDLFSGPNLAEKQALEGGEVVGQIAEDAFIRLLARMGICQGDTLTVHSEDGELVPLKFDYEALPKRPKTKKAAPKPKRTRRKKEAPNDNTES